MAHAALQVPAHAWTTTVEPPAQRVGVGATWLAVVATACTLFDCWLLPYLSSKIIKLFHAYQLAHPSSEFSEVKLNSTFLCHALDDSTKPRYMPQNNMRMYFSHCYL
jgi:hypothetical protein